MASASGLQEYQWERQPGAEGVVRGLVEDFLRRSMAGRKLAERMRVETGTRFADWIDSIVVTDATVERRLIETGFVTAGADDGMKVYRHPEGMFPPVAVGGNALPLMRVALKVDAVADFLAANGLEVAIEGEPFGAMRRAVVAQENEARLEVVERRGWTGFGLPKGDAAKSLAAMRHLEEFRRRRRAFDKDEEGFVHAWRMIDRAIAELGRDYTCALFFAAEREYWQRRNRAGQVQKARQDRLGLGWGNHDHHTYRSSRVSFRELVAVMEKLGLECRERFYAGREAGWGAQVMENPRAGIVVFADVDLAAEELMGDFAHEPLAARDHLGTVGLWCGLHGEAFLQAGMHHLECQFDFAALKKQLEGKHGIAVMKPFTDFPFLKQAFTEGETWPVEAGRIRRLLEAGLISVEQAQQFSKQGAIGSHLENLERNEGYKGFNQKGVSEIISATDPRRNVVAGA